MRLSLTRPHPSTIKPLLVFNPLMSPAYTVSWELAGHQKRLLTCLAISPSGSHLVVASEDRNLLLVDMDDGRVVINLQFDQCAVLAALWHSETNVLVGCENGCLYDICFEPKNKTYAVTMSPFLTPMNEQILSLAFDPTRHLLAVGYGNTVALFRQQSPGRQYFHTGWEMLELIKGPYNNASSLVHVLLFYPIESGRQILLIGYAEAGWNVWSDAASVKRISPDHNHNVCRIGRAALASDGRSIAVSTLDHAIVTYTLGREGPILASMKEFPYQDSAKYTPIVPIASTLDGLTLGGSASGEVPMVETVSGVMSLMRHESKTHLIREIATRGQKIVVGSSSDAESVVKCYSSSAAVIVTGRQIQKPSGPIDVTAIEAMEGWDRSDSRWKVTRQYGPGIGWRLKIGRTMWSWMLSGMLVIVLMLSANPPDGASFEDAMKDSEDTEVLKPQFERHMYWISFGMRHFYKFAKFQITAWLHWMVHALFSVLGKVLCIVPGVLRLALLGVAKLICECVQAYREKGVCPKLEY